MRVKHAQWCVWPLAGQLLIFVHGCQDPSLPSSDVRSQPSGDSGPERVFVWSHLGSFCSGELVNSLTGRTQGSKIIQAMKKQNHSWRYFNNNWASIPRWGTGLWDISAKQLLTGWQSPTALQVCRPLERLLWLGVFPCSGSDEGRRVSVLFNQRWSQKLPCVSDALRQSKMNQEK